ncbi:MAG: DUF4384 domain-containing protein [Geminicoccaceae bacterium]
MRAFGLFLLVLASVSLSIRAAEAGMVVIATTAPDVALGDEFEPGTAMNLPEGAEVTLISVDGTVQTVRGPGGMAGVDRAADEGGSMIEALKQIIRKKENVGGIGAIRGSGNKCDGVDDLLALLQRGCEREAALRIEALAADLRPSLFMGAQKPGVKPVFGLGETIDITLQSNFDGYVFCFHEGSDGTTTRLVPLAGEPPSVKANKPASLAGELGSFGSLVASDPVGVDRLACFIDELDLAGVEPEVFGGPPVLGKGQLDGKVKKTFEALASGRSAAASLELEIVH